MKKQLNVGDRLMVISVLPKEGDFVTIRMIRGLIAKLGLSAEEITDFEIKSEEGNVMWNSKGSVVLDFEFHEAEIDLIKKSLKRLEEDKKLTQDTFTVYEKFCT